MRHPDNTPDARNTSAIDCMR